MKRRSFLLGLLSTTAAVALPHPKVPTGGEVNEVVAALEPAIEFPRSIGIALQNGAPGDLVDVLLSSFGSTIKTRVDRQVYAGGVLTTHDTALWVGKKDDEIRYDIAQMKTLEFVKVDNPEAPPYELTPNLVVVDIETYSSLDPNPVVTITRTELADGLRHTHKGVAKHGKVRRDRRS